MIRDIDFNDKQADLCAAMTNISQCYYCAYWCDGIEFEIWFASRYMIPANDFSRCDPDNLDLCRKLSIDLNGWIAWVDDKVCPGLPPENFGPHFLCMDEWATLMCHENLKAE